MFSSAGVTDDQLQAMWDACREMAGEPDARLACRRLADRISQIIAAPALVFRREVSAWKSAGPPVTSGDRTPSRLDDLPLVPGAACRPVLAANGACWTPIPLDDDFPVQTLLLLPGDWHAGPAAAWLPRLATTASIALRLANAREAARRGDALAGVAYAFARKLGQITGLRLLHQFIVEAAARTARARLAGLSVYEAKAGALVVAATHGYPSDVVGDVRIVPGSGIIGGVFSTKKPLLVRDTTRVPGLSPRSTRYQTASFMALPIVSGRDAIGVLTLADRADGAPFTREDLAATRLITALASLALVREGLAALTDELAHAAAMDPVTSLFNRRYLETRLEAELERSRRTGMPVALVMLDVDGFKSVNDRMGHQMGDTVLRRVADIIKRSVRASDVCTRYGGDEFAIIVPENADSVAQTASRIRQRVARFAWDSIGLPPDVPVTISAGVALGEVGEAAESLIGRADQFLYQAKALGRNCVFPPE